ncbi:cobalt-precorrin-6A reductase [Arsenicicoccus dermatophilus]|uniref:cobalt-precorrin-6A reductase n=1 Tax=Arsenicicoccus dermatophilus TaxID=1076331 RepID=UPI001F4C65E2|nr:cobalt-precorrin-6A reductase [Arsenicicoccus dermatophilus]
MTTRVLLLGGTVEARRLAGLLAQRPESYAVTYSLAGVTSAPRLPTVAVRVGGFGGVDGLARHLRDEQVDVVVDATHPFAARMSHHAAAAGAATGVPVVALRRPGWIEQPGDDWHRVTTLAEAAHVAAALGRRIFLTTGRQEVDEFCRLRDTFCLVRAVDPPDALPPYAELVLAKGPFTVADELALIREHALDVIVTKDSGGDATSAKLEAARRLRLPVVMVDRPAVPDVPEVGTPEAALAWLDAR